MSDQDTTPTLADQVSSLDGVVITPTVIQVPIFHPYGERTQGQAKLLPADPDRFEIRRQVLARDLWKIDADTEGERVGQALAVLADVPLWIVERLHMDDWHRLQLAVLAVLSGKPLASTTQIAQIGS